MVEISNGSKLSRVRWNAISGVTDGEDTAADCADFYETAVTPTDFTSPPLGFAKRGQPAVDGSA